MTKVGIGDMAQSFLLRKQSLALKAETLRLGTEVATGRVSDVARALKGDLVPLAAIETSLTRLSGYRAAVAEAALFARGMQETMAGLDTVSTDLSASLRTAASSGVPAMINAVGIDARQRFESVVAMMNTRLGDRTLFAGQGTGGPAMAAPDTILTAVQGAITAAGAQTADEVQAAVSGWFADPAGYASVAYLGGPPLDVLALSPEDNARLDLTAADPAIRGTIEALALGALLDGPGPPLTTVGRAELARRAADALMTNQADRANLAARLGTVEERVDRAGARNEAETTALEIARARLVEADPYDTTTRLAAAQGQLEALYAVTARLARVTLLDYLK